MKTKIILLSLVLLSPSALADNKKDLCRVVGRTASEIMYQRQLGTSFNTMMKTIGNGATNQMLSMIDDVYAQPIAANSTDAVRQISEYGVRYAIDCYENKDKYGMMRNEKTIQR